MWLLSLTPRHAVSIGGFKADQLDYSTAVGISIVYFREFDDRFLAGKVSLNGKVVKKSTKVWKTLLN